MGRKRKSMSQDMQTAKRRIVAIQKTKEQL
jgi:hypothetical protein